MSLLVLVISRTHLMAVRDDAPAWTIVNLEQFFLD